MAATKYTEEQVHMGLAAVIAWRGNCAAAARTLEERKELTIHKDTLRAWKDHQYADLYFKMREELAEQLEQLMVVEARDTIGWAGQVQREAIERTHGMLDDKTLRATEMAQIAFQMSKVRSGEIDKLLTLTGRPQTITATRDAGEIMRQLESLKVLEVKNEATDAE